MASSPHKGYGKLILFGEHFVVYKVPALVAAVSDYTDCTVQIGEGSGLETIDNRPAVPGYKVEKKDEQDEATKLVSNVV
jgi:mevalonate kinase